jgi:hypothetical protein
MTKFVYKSYYCTVPSSSSLYHTYEYDTTYQYQVSVRLTIHNIQRVRLQLSPK